MSNVITYDYLVDTTNGMEFTVETEHKPNGDVIKQYATILASSDEEES